MKHFFCLLFGLTGLQAFSQNYMIPWRMEPRVDSLDRSCRDSMQFKIYSHGKTGWFHAKEGLLVPPAFDEAGQPLMLDNNYNYIRITTVKNGKYKGLYRTVKKYPVDTALVLECIYDTLEFVRVEDMLRIRVTKGKETGMYDPVYLNWTEKMHVPLKKVPAKNITKNPSMPQMDGEPNGPGPDQEEDRLVSRLAKPGKRRGLNQGNPDGSAGRGEPGGKEDRHTVVEEEPRKTKNISRQPLGYSGKAIDLYIWYNEKYLKGVYSKSGDSLLIKPKYMMIELYDSFIYTYTPNYPREIQVFNLRGDTLTPYLLAVRVLKNNGDLKIAYRMDNDFQIYSNNFQLLLPGIYKEYATTSRPEILKLTTEHSCYFFNTNTLKLLPDSFDNIHLTGSNGKMLAERNHVLYLYEPGTQKTTTLKGYEFVYGADSIGVLAKSKKQFLVNLNTGKIAKKGWDKLENANDAIREKISDKIFPRIFIAEKNGKKGLIGEQGEILLKPEYDSLLSPLVQFPELLAFKKDSRINVYHVFKKQIILQDIEKINSKLIARNFPEGGNYFSENKERRTWLVMYEKGGKLGYITHPDSSICPPEMSGISIINSRLFFRNGKAFIYFDPLKPACNSAILYDTAIYKQYFIELFKDSLIYCLQYNNSLFPPNGTRNISEVSIYGKPSHIFFYEEKGKLGIIHNRFKTKAVLDQYQTGLNGILWVRQNGLWGVVDWE